MTVEDSRRVRAVAQRITDISLPDVQADIDALQRNTHPPAWVADATLAMQARYGGVNIPRPSVGTDETIVFAVGTPVFLVKGNAIDIDSARVEANAWRTILTANASNLNRVMRSVGRIDVSNFDSDFVGTAWVIDDGLVVTNRHVANLFAEAQGTGFKFKLGFDARTQIGVKVDFLEEFQSAGTDEVKVEGVVWVAPDSGPDVAFLKLETQSSPVGRVKLELSPDIPRAKLPVAVVGYPASDARFSDKDLADKIFGGVYDKKRVAVGNLLGIGDEMITHSCSTLGGNSGSPVIDIGTGKVVALHYRGIEFIENDAVPVTLLRRCLERARGLLETSGGMKMGDSDGGTNTGRVTFTVPLKITIELDGTAFQSGVAVVPTGGPFAPTATVSTGAGGGPGPGSGNADKEQTLQAVRKAHTLLANREDVVAIKAGYRFENGEITDQRAVVIAVKRKVESGALESRGVLPLPPYIDGVRTDVTTATTADLLGMEASDEAAKSWRTSYVPRPDLPLGRRKASMKFVVHSGPDASWPQLSAFLAQTRKSLVIAMYDFGAVHVADGVISAVKGKTESIALVLQMGGKVHDKDLTDYQAVERIRAEKGDKFDFAAASVGKSGIFDSAYHIKVAVRDHAAMWLSSGNWQRSNQPAVSPLDNPEDAASALRLYNREWHAILEDRDLSALYEAHILRDLTEARAAAEGAVAEEQFVLVPADMPGEMLEAAQKPRYFEPLTGDREVDVQPILTPDNYIDIVLPFIQSARRTIYFQNQSFNTRTVGERYRQLLDALLAKQREGLDVRIIFRSFGPDDRDTISNAKDYGFDTSRLRKQKNCHTKGIIIDSESVLIGSHNWTTAGTGFNRDASLIFYDREIARFYEDLFLYDWGRIGPAKIDETLPPPITMVTNVDQAPPPGYIAVPVSTILG